MKPWGYILFSLALFLSVTQVSHATTIDSVNRYAWSENAGWIDFGTTLGNVQVSATKITGYAFSPSIGWISLHCENTNTCTDVSYGVTRNGADIAGFAWSENAGWIDFNNVTLNSEEVFSGYAFSPSIGWISFNCENTGSCGDISFSVQNAPVETPAISVPVSTGGGGGGGGSSNKLNIICSVSEKKIGTGSVVVLDAKVKNGTAPFNYSWTGDVDDVEGMSLQKQTQNITVGKAGIFNFKVQVVDSKGKKVSDLCPTITVDDKYGSVLGVATSTTPTLPVSVPTDVPFSTLVTESQKVSNITRDLMVGSVGEDVKKLQIFLNSVGYTVAQTGPGSLGNETDYFGNLTRTALARYQADHGVSPSVGYFGPITRAFIKSKGM